MAKVKGNKARKQQGKKQKSTKPRATKVEKEFSLAESGASLGSTLGSALGKLGGNLISKLTGFGEYSISNNTVAEGNAIPSFYNEGDGVVVCHREFLGDIAGTTSFTLSSYPINPGLSATFPWLSSLANNFEEYEMLGLVFEYRPLSGMAISSSSATMGVVVYATDYNAYNPSFATKQQMESYEYATSVVPFQQMLHPVECKPGSAVFSKRYVRSSGVSDGTLLNYDMGNFQLATTGMQSAYTVGELWVSYHVRLSKPRIDLTPNTGTAHFVSSNAGTATGAVPCGTAGWVTRHSGLPIKYSALSSTLIFNGTGTYLVSLVGKFTATVTAAIVGTYGTNITNLAIFNNNTDSGVSSFTSTTSSVTFTVKVNAAGTTTATNGIVFAGTGGTAGNVDVFVTALASDESV